MPVMDFYPPEEHSAFRDMAQRWVDKECPKDCARKLEADEHDYPHALWDKFSEAGFHGIRHPRGIWRPGRRRLDAQWTAPA